MDRKEFILQGYTQYKELLAMLKKHSPEFYAELPQDILDCQTKDKPMFEGGCMSCPHHMKCSRFCAFLIYLEFQQVSGLSPVGDIMDRRILVPMITTIHFIDNGLGLISAIKGIEDTSKALMLILPAVDEVKLAEKAMQEVQSMLASALGIDISELDIEPSAEVTKEPMPEIPNDNEPVDTN